MDLSRKAKGNLILYGLLDGEIRWDCNADTYMQTAGGATHWITVRIYLIFHHGVLKTTR